MEISPQQHKSCYQVQANQSVIKNQQRLFVSPF